MYVYVYYIYHFVILWPIDAHRIFAKTGFKYLAKHDKGTAAKAVLPRGTRWRGLPALAFAADQRS